MPKTGKMIVNPAGRGLVSAMLAAAVLCASLPAAGAKEKRDHLGDFRDWSTFRDIKADGAKVCYMISIPKQTGADKPNVNRGKIYVMISHWPSMSISDQVRISGGYPYKEKSLVVASIDAAKFDLFTDGQDAWAHDQQEDKKMIAAMKAGVEMVVEGESSRGTKTTDSFSLNGFTAAYKTITDACK